jgi:intein/homing endonuclease
MNKTPTEKEIRELYHGQQMSMTDVASEFGMTIGGIQHYFKKLGINTRNRKESATKYTKQDCLDALQNSVCVDMQLTIDVYDSYSNETEPSARRISTIFGSWNEAKKSAGFSCTEQRGSLEVNSDYFKEINTKKKAYWLGFIYGDGCVTENQSGSPVFCMTLKAEDVNHVRKLKKAIDSQHSVVVSNDMARIKITSPGLVAGLDSHGVDSEKTFSGSMPEIDDKYKRAFVRGLVDADGSLQNGTFQIAGQRNRLERVAEWIPFETYFYEHPNWGAPQLKVRNPIGSGSRSWLYPDGKDTEPALERKKEEVTN